ncbi:putative metalloprotease CJM1_0395 family protein [Azospirillum sp. HJ39]|uniref:putative metalloprotease CJM1_0395 family protein n=1 Tax=Azospirillum sp. HJ39 TaxID=3159496 RepID=UPI003557CBF4
MAADVSISSLSIGTYSAPRSQPLREDGKGASAARTGAAESTTGSAAGSATDTVTLSDAAQQQVQKLKQADTNVRRHEAAHQAAGGSHAGGASFTYTRGPDGKNYATAGEVPVDASAESEPAATIAKMEQVKAAALAPADPSPQDMRVAAQADATKLQAQAELRRQGGDGGGGGDGAAARAAAAYGAAQGLGSGAGRGAGLTV